jgi:hypothetical protein
MMNKKMIANLEERENKEVAHLMSSLRSNVSNLRMKHPKVYLSSLCKKVLKI